MAQSETESSAGWQKNQITARYGQELMEEICTYKLSSEDLKESETRFHPDAPNVEAGPLTENSLRASTL